MNEQTLRTQNSYACVWVKPSGLQCSVEIYIPGQIFRKSDLEELIAFLEQLKESLL